MVRFTHLSSEQYEMCVGDRLTYWRLGFFDQELCQSHRSSSPLLLATSSVPPRAYSNATSSEDVIQIYPLDISKSEMKEYTHGNGFLANESCCFYGIGSQFHGAEDDKFITRGGQSNWPHIIDFLDLNETHDSGEICEWILL
jgi:hypothetical protein